MLYKYIFLCISNFLQVHNLTNKDGMSSLENDIDFDIMCDTNHNIVKKAEYIKIKSISDDITNGSENSCFTVSRNFLQLNETEETVLNDFSTCDSSTKDIFELSSAVSYSVSSKEDFKDENIFSSTYDLLKSSTESCIIEQDPLAQCIKSIELNNPNSSNAEESFSQVGCIANDITSKILQENNSAKPPPNISLNEPEASLSDVTNFQDQVKLQFPKLFQNVLFWPNDELKKNAKRSKQKRKMPSVLSSEEWKKLKMEEEEAKRKSQEDKEIRKKLKLEKQQLNKVKKEQNEIKKREAKIRREELKLQKENDNIKKQEERLKKMEVLKNKKEEELRKKKSL